MAGLETTKFTDCIIISKKFERAAAYAVTEESVFAMMTPLLTTTRIQSQAFITQTETSETLSTPTSTQQALTARSATAPNAVVLNPLGDEIQSPNLRNLDKAQEGDEGFFTRIAGNFFPPEGNLNDLGGAFNSKCIPCGFRLDNWGQLIEATFTSPLGGMSEYLQMWDKWLSEHLKQLMDLINMFTNMDRFVDMCALIRFLNDFVCIPDLQRMLSALMALMSRTSFEFNGIFDLILQLIGPLLAPFLSGIVGTLQQYILMIIQPLECIIDAIQNIMSKLDYNILFQNIESLDKHISLGPKKGARLPGTFNDANEKKFRKEDPRGPIKVPFIDAEIPRRDIVDDERFIEVDFNLAGPIGTAIKSENASNQAAVEQAAEELAAIRRAGRNIDGSDAAAVATQRGKEQKAKESYKASIEKRDLSVIGRTNKQIDETVAGLKSSLMMMIGFLREAAQAVEAFFNDIFIELKKLMGEYLGGSGGFIAQLVKKLAMVQLIGLIASIIAAFQNGVNCSNENEDIKVENFLPIQQGMKIWTDDQGNIHIEENPDDIDAAVDEMVKAFGVEPAQTAAQAKEIDRGTGPSTSRQKLNSLIEFTGDPILDTQIARATEQLVTPIRAVFKCPLQTSVAQTEQVNKWVSELNT